MACQYKLCDMSGIVPGIRLTNGADSVVPMNMVYSAMLEMLRRGYRVKFWSMRCQCRVDYMDDRAAEQYNSGERKVDGINWQQAYMKNYRDRFVQNQIIFDRIDHDYTSTLMYAIERLNFLKKGLSE